LIWGAAVSLGLGVLLQASEIAYSMVKFAGAVKAMDRITGGIFVAFGIRLAVSSRHR
jgi:threonine/homoserine/homoserine lactone efflux protein